MGYGQFNYDTASIPSSRRTFHIGLHAARLRAGSLGSRYNVKHMPTKSEVIEFLTRDFPQSKVRRRGIAMHPPL